MKSVLILSFFFWCVWVCVRNYVFLLKMVHKEKRKKKNEKRKKKKNKTKQKNKKWTQVSQTINFGSTKLTKPKKKKKNLETQQNNTTFS